MLRASSIDHINMAVKSLDESVEFYGGVEVGLHSRPQRVRDRAQREAGRRAVVWAPSVVGSGAGAGKEPYNQRW